MAKRKGMSLEEKRQTMLDIFHESKDVFILKDLEKAGAKRGVVLQSVKEVLQSLVDDDMVHLEKIGISNYYWAFPGELAAKLEAERSRLEARLAERRSERAALEAQLATSRAGKEDSGERQQLAAQLAALQADVVAKQAELAGYADNDPERFDHLKSSCQIACDAANRWLDNLEALRGWLRKRFEGKGPEIDELFREAGVKEDVPYLSLDKLLP